MGKTLWQRWTEKPEKPVELQYFNPCELKIGNSVTVDVLDYRQYHFTVNQIREYKRYELPDGAPFTDYVLLAKPVDKEDVWVRLRVFPKTDRMPPFQAVLLSLYFECANEDSPDSAWVALDKTVRDKTGKLQDLEDGKVVGEYWRPTDANGNQILREYNASVNIIQASANGKVEKSGVQQQSLEYWDYSRIVKDEANQKLEEFLFVEMDKDNGWFQLWRGAEVDSRNIVPM